MEVCDSVLGEEADEVQPPNGKFAFRRWESRSAMEKSGSVRSNVEENGQPDLKSV